MKYTRTAAAILVTALVATPAAAGAQEPVKSFDQLGTRLKPGDTVWVTDAQGREIKGKIESLGAEALTLNADGSRTFPARDVTLVRERQRDSLKNGTLIGLGVGGGIALAWCLGAVSASDYYAEEDASVECAEGTIVFGGLGTLIGLGIDAALPGKMRVAYRAAGAGGHARLSIAPVITSRTRAVAVSFTF
jgi:hypothetical protein